MEQFMIGWNRSSARGKFSFFHQSSSWCSLFIGGAIYTCFKQAACQVGVDLMKIYTAYIQWVYTPSPPPTPSGSNSFGAWNLLLAVLSYSLQRQQLFLSKNRVVNDAPFYRDKAGITRGNIAGMRNGCRRKNKLQDRVLKFFNWLLRIKKM